MLFVSSGMILLFEIGRTFRCVCKIKPNPQHMREIPLRRQQMAPLPRDRKYSSPGDSPGEDTAVPLGDRRGCPPTGEIPGPCKGWGIGGSEKRQPPRVPQPARVKLGLRPACLLNPATLDNFQASVTVIIVPPGQNDISGS